MLVASFLIGVMAKAGRRANAHLLAGRRGREFGWYMLAQVACLGVIVLPFYEGRATVDAVSALAESVSQPRVPGGGSDQAMAALTEAGFDRTVAFVTAFAEADRADNIELYRSEVEDNLIGDLPWYSRWYVRTVDGGRLRENMEGIAATQEYRILPLLSTAAYARELCAMEKPPSEARELFERRAQSFEFVDPSLVANVVAEMAGRCAEFESVVDADAVRADIDAFEKPSVGQMLWAGLSLQYEPGQRERAEG